MGWREETFSDSLRGNPQRIPGGIGGFPPGIWYTKSLQDPARDSTWDVRWDFPYSRVISHPGLYVGLARSCLEFYRASDNSREKKWNFAGFEETNSRRKRPISREFRGNFRGKFSPKSEQESKNERFLKKYQKDVKFRAKKKHKSSFNTVLKATVLVSSDKKNIKIFTEMLGLLFQVQFRAENSNAINFFPPIALVLFCSLEGKIVRDGRFKSICERSQNILVSSIMSCTND